MKRISMLIAAGLFLLAAAIVPTIRAVAQQTAVTDDNLNQMITSAKTPADHEAIAVYYDTEAAENEKKASIHSRNKNMYTKLDFSAHCNALIRDYQQAAKQDKALAAFHREMAKKDAGQ
jgi:hypothetical protein